MSSYWAVYSGVPRRAREGMDIPEGAARLGMFDEGRGRWSRSLEVKTSLFGNFLSELFGEEFYNFFRYSDDAVSQMEPLMEKIPALLELIPGVIARVEGMDVYKKQHLLDFLRALGPTLRRIQLQCPHGRGWAIVVG